MKENVDHKNLGNIEAKISLFLGTEFSEELKKLRLLYTKPLENWFTETRDELVRIKKDDNYYPQKIAFLQAKIPELNSIIGARASRDWYHSFSVMISEVAKSLPEEMTEELCGFHLKASDDESTYVKIVKSTKRLKSTVLRYPLNRTVYPRQLFIEHILANKDWVERLAGNEFEAYSEFLDLLITIDEIPSEIDNDENAQNKIPDDFTSQIISNLEERVLSAVQLFKEREQNSEEYVEKIIEPFANELIKKGKLAGTFQQPQKKKDLDKVDFSSIKTFNAQQDEWYKYVASQLNDLKINVEIARYGLSAATAKDSLKRVTHDYFRDVFYLPLSKAKKHIQQTLNEISELKKDDDIKKKLDQFRSELKKDIETDLLEVSRDPQPEMQTLHDIQRIISDLQAETRHFSESVDLASKREKNLPVPVIEISTIRWQSQAARYLKEEVIRNLDPAKQEFNLLTIRGKNILEEATQIVDVNLQAAIESISDKKGTDKTETESTQSPQDISIEGLNRATSTLDAGIQEIREKDNVYETLVETLIPTALKTLSGNMLRREFQHLKMQDKALLVKEQALDWKQKLTSQSAVIFEKVEIGYRFTSYKFREYSRIVKPYLGIRGEEVVSIREKRNLAEYLASSGTPLNIPFVYERLFNLDFPIDHRFYVPPNNGIQLVESSFNEWKRGLSTNVVVVGEKGSGKTTLIRFAEEQCMSDEKLIEITFSNTFIEEKELLKRLCDALGFKPVDTKEEFINKVHKKKKREVVIVENLQNISIRSINGFEALEAFWVIMTSTMDKLFWLVSCSRYSWEFFMKITEADQYFSHIVQTDRLSEYEIKEAILTRHKSTGYELFFEPDESIRKSRAFKKLLGDQEESQELVMKHFFSKLYKVSEGNISIGMIFWLKSIKDIEEHRFVFHPIEVTDIDKLEVPSVNVLFTLATIVQHDVLTREEIALALDEGASNSGLMLARLKTKGIILETENGFKLNHLVYRQVVRILKQRNIIH